MFWLFSVGTCWSTLPWIWLMSMFLNYIEKLVRCTCWSVSVLSWLSICCSRRSGIDCWRHLSQKSFFLWYLLRCREVSREAYTFFTDDFVCWWCNFQFCFCSLLVLFLPWFSSTLCSYLRMSFWSLVNLLRSSSYCISILKCWVCFGCP